MPTDEQIRSSLEDLGVDQVIIEDFMQNRKDNSPADQALEDNSELGLYYKMEEAQDWRTRAKYAAKILGLNYK